MKSDQDASCGATMISQVEGSSGRRCVSVASSISSHYRTRDTPADASNHLIIDVNVDDENAKETRPNKRESAPPRKVDMTREEMINLLGIPAYHPPRYGGMFLVCVHQRNYLNYPIAAERNYNYEEKYPPDPPGEEMGPNARFWHVYLDEAEIFDQDLLRTNRDLLDSLLVFVSGDSQSIPLLLIKLFR